jgi:hypothetical protein
MHPTELIKIYPKDYYAINGIVISWGLMFDSGISHRTNGGADIPKLLKNYLRRLKPAATKSGIDLIRGSRTI